MNNKLDDLLDLYNNIEIPDNLDKVVEDTYIKWKHTSEKEKVETTIDTNILTIPVKGKKNINFFTKVSILVATLLIVFIFSINISPAFAKNLSKIPVLGKFVKIIKFNKNVAKGGLVTDGTDIKFINLQQNKDSENIIINFSNKYMKINSSPSYDIKYKEYPYTLTFTINGARHISAEKYFNTLKKSKFVADIYTLMTPDDSVIRFNIVFNVPVNFTLKEYKNPANIMLTLKNKVTTNNVPVYSIRTKSSNNLENLANLEELLLSEKNLRILKDRNNCFLIELNQFSSEKEAKSKLRELRKKYTELKDIFIEKRNHTDIPKFM